MIEATCHCGAVRLELPRAPDTLTSCNCSICRRTGGLWAYYSRGEVQRVGETDSYVWGDRTLALHRCKVCGVVAYWLGLDAKLERMGVNARLMDPAVVAAARVRHLDGADTWEYFD